jgi:threonine/homoserine/homoserine lactone efflux protein
MVIVLQDALTFIGIVVVLTVTPGADMALLMRHVLAHGFRATWPTVAGIVSGLMVHATLCVAGLSVVLRESEVAFTTVKLAGGAWLSWIGISTLLAAIQSRGRTVEEQLEGEPAGDDDPNGFRFRTLYVRGLLTNILNVKIALLYIALLPQFAPSGDRFVPVALALAAIQASIGVLWLFTYAAAIARARDALKGNPRVQRWIEGSTGAALVGLGARLASAAR